MDKLDKKGNHQKLFEPPGVHFINFFAPYALAPNFYASKKLLKKLGVGIGRKWIELSL